MDINRSVVESILACFVVALGCQLTRFFYVTHQLSYLAFLFIRLAICGIVLGSVYYLKRQSDVGELSSVIIGSLVGLWIEN